HGEWPLDDLRDRVAHADVFQVARRGAADLLVAIALADALERLRLVAVRLDRAVLAALPRGVALGAEAPGVSLAHDRAVVGREGGAVRLLDRAPGEGRGLVLEIEQDAGAHHAVTFADRAAPPEVGAPVHRVDAGQAADVAGDDPVHREQDRGRRHAGGGPEGVAVAD